MWRKGFIVIGIIFFIIGLGFTVILALTNQSAKQMDGMVLSEAPNFESTCGQISIEVDVEKRIMTEKESQLLQLFLQTDSPTSCMASVDLNAVNFNLSPSATHQEVTLRPEVTSALTWVISPQKTGQYTIAVVVNQAIITLGISVTTVLGLTAAQAQLLSILGPVLGPMLTIPWWYEQWQKRKQPKTDETSKSVSNGHKGGVSL